MIISNDLIPWNRCAICDKLWYRLKKYTVNCSQVGMHSMGKFTFVIKQHYVWWEYIPLTDLLEYSGLSAAAVRLSRCIKWFVRGEPPRKIHQGPLLSTHWGRDKMAAIFQMTFSNIFSWMKMHELRLRFNWSLSNWQYSSIGSDNGFAPARRQAIVWTNDG